MKEKLINSLLFFVCILFFFLIFFLFPASWLRTAFITETSLIYILGGAFAGILAGILIIYNGAKINAIKLGEKNNFRFAVGFGLVLRLLFSINDSISTIIGGVLIFIFITVIVYMIVKLILELRSEPKWDEYNDEFWY